MFIGDGAKLVRDAFELAKEKAPAIIFIDELDAIGTKRFDSEKSGDREVQRTMLELLNQLDGFSSDARIKASLVLWQLLDTQLAKCLGYCCYESYRYSRPCPSPFRTIRPQDRVPPTKRDSSSSHSRNPLSQNDCQS
jgi:hypothetical protein